MVWRALTKVKTDLKLIRSAVRLCYVVLTEKNRMLINQIIYNASDTSAFDIHPVAWNASVTQEFYFLPVNASTLPEKLETGLSLRILLLYKTVFFI